MKPTWPVASTSGCDITSCFCVKLFVRLTVGSIDLFLSWLAYLLAVSIFCAVLIKLFDDREHSHQETSAIEKYRSSRATVVNHSWTNARKGKREVEAARFLNGEVWPTFLFSFSFFFSTELQVQCIPMAIWAKTKAQTPSSPHIIFTASLSIATASGP